LRAHKVLLALERRVVIDLVGVEEVVEVDGGEAMIHMTTHHHRITILHQTKGSVDMDPPINGDLDFGLALLAALLRDGQQVAWGTMAIKLAPAEAGVAAAVAAGTMVRAAQGHLLDHQAPAFQAHDMRALALDLPRAGKAARILSILASAQNDTPILLF